MSFDPFDSQLYTQPIEQPVVETEVEPLQETSSREYNTMLEPEPTDIEDILDHYKNLKLTDDEIDELRVELQQRNSMDLAILYDELLKLHKQTIADPKDKLFLNEIQGELERRGPNAMADAKAAKKAELYAMKQDIVSKRQLVKQLEFGEKRDAAIAAQKQEEADYQRMIHEFYTEWEHIKALGFEFPFMNTGKATGGSKLPKPITTTDSTEDYQIPVAKNAEEEMNFAKTVNLNPLPGHNEFTRNPAKFGSVKPEALDINAEPEAAIIEPDKTPYDMGPRKPDYSDRHPSISDKRVDKEALLAKLKESTTEELCDLHDCYTLFNEEEEHEVNTEMLTLIQEELLNR